MVHSGSGATGATVLPDKATGGFVVEFFLSHIGVWGFVDVVIRSDQEPALKSVLAEVKARRKGRTLIEHSPKYSHQSVGVAEQANGAKEDQTRTLIDRVNHATGADVDAKSATMAWAVRHAGWLLTRYRVLSTGQTSYEKIPLKKYSGAIVEYGEVVHARDTNPATLSNKADPLDRGGLVRENGGVGRAHRRALERG